MGERAKKMWAMQEDADSKFKNSKKRALLQVLLALSLGSLFSYLCPHWLSLLPLFSYLCARSCR